MDSFELVNETFPESDSDLDIEIVHPTKCQRVFSDDDCVFNIEWLFEEQTPRPSSSDDVGDQSSSESLGDFEEVDFRLFDLWDDTYEEVTKKRKKKKSKKGAVVKAKCSDSNDQDVNLDPEMTVSQNPTVAFSETLHLQQPDTQVYVNPLVLLSFLAQLQDEIPTTDAPGTSKSIVPIRTQSRGHAVGRPSQTTRFRAMYFRCRKQANALRKELQLSQEVLELKTWMLETMAGELRITSHDKATLTKANSRLATENHNMKRGLKQQQRMAVSTATSSAAASVLQKRNNDLVREVLTIRRCIDEVMTEKEQLIENIANMTSELAQTQAFVKVVQGDLENFVYDLVANGVVKVTDCNGNAIFVERVPQADPTDSSWTKVKTRKNEVRFLAVVSAQDATIEKQKKQLEQLLSDGDLKEGNIKRLEEENDNMKPQIQEMENKFKAEHCMGIMAARQLEDAKAEIEELKTSDRKEYFHKYMAERQRATNVKVEFLKMERDLLAKVDSLEQALDAAKILCDQKLRACDKCNHTNSRSSKEELVKSTQHDSQISLRPRYGKKAFTFPKKPEPEGAEKMCEAVFGMDTKTQSYMGNWKNTIDEVKKQAYNLTRCWDPEKTGQEGSSVNTTRTENTQEETQAPNPKKRSTKVKEIDVEAGVPEEEEVEQNSFVAALKKLLLQADTEEMAEEKPVIPSKKARMTATILDPEPTMSLIPTTVETIVAQWPDCKTLKKVSTNKNVKKECAVIQTQPQNKNLPEDRNNGKPLKVLWKPLVAEDVSPKYDEKTPSFMPFKIKHRKQTDDGKNGTQITELAKTTNTPPQSLCSPNAGSASAVAHGHEDDVESCIGATAALCDEPCSGTGTAVWACQGASANPSSPRSSPTEEDSAILSWEAEVVKTSEKMEDARLQDTGRNPCQSIITPWLGCPSGSSSKPLIPEDKRNFTVKHMLATKESHGHRYQQPKKQPGSATKMKPRKQQKAAFHGPKPY